jgi:1-acyl-sn-glycerol-3-phosphate acyltransferase
VPEEELTMALPRPRLIVTYALMTAGALVMLLVAIPTLFLARRLYSEVVGRALGWAVLRLWGVRFNVHYAEPVPRRQVVYVSNHESTLDVFLYIGLALRRTRFFMGAWVKSILPFGIVGRLIRNIWTVPQEFPEERRRIFMNAERILRRSGDSVYLSPEGMRVTTGSIGHFNKGSFHLATALRAPIVPFYIYTPPEINPGMGNDTRPGLMEVFFLPVIDTSEWRLEDLEANRDRVRELYVRVHTAMHATRRLPADLHIRPLMHEPAEALV